MIIQILDDEIYNEINLNDAIEYVNLPNIHIIYSNSFRLKDFSKYIINYSCYGMIIQKAMS